MLGQVDGRSHIRRQTRRRFAAEEKIRIIQEGLRCEESIAALCRREGLNPNLYYRWSKEFLEAGKKRLSLPETDRRGKRARWRLALEDGELMPESENLCLELEA